MGIRGDAGLRTSSGLRSGRRVLAAAPPRDQHHLLAAYPELAVDAAQATRGAPRPPVHLRPGLDGQLGEDEVRLHHQLTVRSTSTTPWSRVRARMTDWRPSERVTKSPARGISLSWPTNTQPRWKIRSICPRRRADRDTGRRGCGRSLRGTCSRWARRLARSWRGSVVRSPVGSPAMRGYSPRSLNPGWASGRRPSGQWYLRSDSLMGRSLMLARRSRIRPSSSNSQFSLPYERNQFPESSWHS